MNIFEQFGFIATGKSGDNVSGNCIFCGKASHFFVNEEKKRWDCKVCGVSGGYATFLADAVEMSRKHFIGDAAKTLSTNRGLRVSTLKAAGIGFNPWTNRYIVPIFSSDNKVANAKHYDIKSKMFIGTTGCHASLWGLETFTDQPEIYLCEGEWDGLAMREALSLAEVDNVCVMAVPGAGTFKLQWAQTFFDRKVFVLYDNDEAGWKGALKVHAILEGKAEQRFLLWQKDRADKFDVRDLYLEHKKDPAAFLTHIRGACRSEPKNFMPTESDAPREEGPTVVRSTERVTRAEVVAKFQKWLHLPDTSILDVMFGTFLANRLQGDPVWMFFVAPPGATKTELLMSAFGAHRVMSTTSLTPHALVSGVNLQTGDPSMIPRLNGKVLIIKDFTTILNLNPNAREEIFGILRDAYDGKTEKQFANGIFRSYDSKFGIIAGVTPAIELFAEENAALGERFLRWKVELPDDVASFIRKAISNSNQETLMRAELKEIGHKVLGYEYTEVPEIPEVIQDKIVALAQFVALMRGTVTRDKYSKEITQVPFHELGTRLAKQLVKISCGMSQFRGEATVSEAVYEITRRLGRGTVPIKMDHLLYKLYSEYGKGEFEMSAVSAMTALPSTTIQRVIEGMCALKILKKSKLSTIKATYSISSSFLKLISISEVYCGSEAPSASL